MKYKVWAAIPVGDLQYEKLEKVVEINDNLDYQLKADQLVFVLDNLLSDLGVITCIEPVEEKSET